MKPTSRGEIYWAMSLTYIDCLVIRHWTVIVIVPGIGWALSLTKCCPPCSACETSADPFRDSGQFEDNIPVSRDRERGKPMECWRWASQQTVKSATVSKYSELAHNALSITAKWAHGGTLLVHKLAFECLVMDMKCQSHGLAHGKYPKMWTIILIITITQSGKRAGLFPSDKHPSGPALPLRLPSCVAAPDADLLQKPREGGSCVYSARSRSPEADRRAPVKCSAIIWQLDWEIVRFSCSFFLFWRWYWYHDLLLASWSL